LIGTTTEPPAAPELLPTSRATLCPTTISAGPIKTTRQPIRRNGSRLKSPVIGQEHSGVNRACLASLRANGLPFRKKSPGRECRYARDYEKELSGKSLVQ